MTARVGVLRPSAGGLANLGTWCERAVELARDRAQAESNGASQIEIVYCDVNSADEATAESRRAIDAGASVLMGTVVTPHSLAASAAAAERGVPYLEVAAAGDDFSARGLPNLFRFSVRASEYGAGTVDCFAAGGAAAPRLGVAFQESEFGRSVASGFRRRSAEVGAHLVVDHAVTDGDDADAIAAATGKSELDLLLLVQLGHPRTAQVWTALLDANAPVRCLAGNANWGYRVNVAHANGAQENTLVIGTPSIGTFNDEVLDETALADVERWLEVCDDTRETHAVLAPVDRDLFYSGALVLFRAMLGTQDSTPTGVAAALRSLDVPLGGTPVGFGVKFDDVGENERAFLGVSRWAGPRRKTVWPPSLAVAGL